MDVVPVDAAQGARHHVRDQRLRRCGAGPLQAAAAGEHVQDIGVDDQVQIIAVRDEIGQESPRGGASPIRPGSKRDVSRIPPLFQQRAGGAGERALVEAMRIQQGRIDHGGVVRIRMDAVGQRHLRHVEAGQWALEGRAVDEQPEHGPRQPVAAQPFQPRFAVGVDLLPPRPKSIGAGIGGLRPGFKAPHEFHGGHPHRARAGDLSVVQSQRRLVAFVDQRQRVVDEGRQERADVPRAVGDGEKGDDVLGPVAREIRAAGEGPEDGFHLGPVQVGQGASDGRQVGFDRGAADRGAVDMQPASLEKKKRTRQDDRQRPRPDELLAGPPAPETGGRKHGSEAGSAHRVWRLIGPRR